MKQIINHFVFAILLATSTMGFCRSDVRVAVLYPEVNKPYSIVFDQIIDGIKNNQQVDVAQYGIPENHDLSSINDWLTKEKPDAIIALGRRGTEVIENLNVSVPTVVGGILHASDSYIATLPGISLTPDPDLLFRRLATFSPNTSRVYVVYNPENYQWLIDIAKHAAESWKLTLIAMPASNIRESALAHKKIVELSEHSRDAIWLLQDSTTVGRESILPYILKESWEKKLLIFSSNPGHVARGVLFSLFADNQKLGSNLADLTVSLFDGSKKTPNTLTPLRSVRVAVNTRTAGHIEIRIPFEAQRNFDLVFPRR